MDFWYRGCGWCMYAMPQVKELARDFKDKPVAILGMNTDRDLADARFVVKELALNYPQLQATGLPEKFAVQGFPTLIIIDQQGTVRDIHVGYSPNLRETVSKKIESLLK
jgi:thiol-disulfide isomerase/thioredoxin